MNCGLQWSVKQNKNQRSWRDTPSLRDLSLSPRTTKLHHTKHNLSPGRARPCGVPGSPLSYLSLVAEPQTGERACQKG